MRWFHFSLQICSRFLPEEYDDNKLHCAISAAKKLFALNNLDLKRKTLEEGEFIEFQHHWDWISGIHIVPNRIDLIFFLISHIEVKLTTVLNTFFHPSTRIS